MTTASALVERLVRVPMPPARRFDPRALDALPEPARRWLTRVIAPGTPLYRRADLVSHGSIRLRSWHAFTARQTLVPDRGFVWTARTRIAGLPASGYDCLEDDWDGIHAGTDSGIAGGGRQRWRVLGVPFVVGAGPDVTRSAADRLAAECVLLPTGLVTAHWHGVHTASDAARDSADYVRQVAGRFARSRVRVRVAPDGELREVTMRRWGDPLGRGYGDVGFRVRFAGELSRDGVTIPREMTAAWLLPDGTCREFFHAVVDGVTFE